MTSDIADVLAADAGVPASQRRRGAVLRDAILAAAYTELAEAGYTAFSMENVAARARTGKASIYRRWPSKQTLVMDALVTHMPGPTANEPTLGIEDSLGTADALRQVGRLIVATLNSPAGRAVRAIKLEAAGDPELAQLVDDQFQAPRRAALLELLRRGVTRGEVRAEAATELVADVLPALLAHRVVMRGEVVSADDVEAIIEKIMVPLVSTGR